MTVQAVSNKSGRTPMNLAAVADRLTKLRALDQPRANCAVHRASDLQQAAERSSVLAAGPAAVTVVIVANIAIAGAIRMHVEVRRRVVILGNARSIFRVTSCLCRAPCSKNA